MEASVHRRAQCALRWMQGMVSMAANRRAFSSGSRMYVSIKREYLAEHAHTQQQTNT